MASRVSIHHQFVHGTAWIGLSQYSTYAVQFTLLTILARILRPPDFGIVAMVLVYTGFASIFVTSGFTAAVIQDRQSDDASISTLFWLATAFAFLLVVATFAVAPLIERLVDLPGAAKAMEVASPLLIFSACASIATARLHKDLRFGTVAICSFGSAVIGGLVAVAAALAGARYWALIFQALVSSATNVVFLLTFGRWRPVARFELGALRRLFHFSSSVVGFGTVNYWARNADNLLIGKYLGASQLGVYSLAYSLMMIPQQAVTNIVSRALHPALAAVQEDRMKGRDLYTAVLNVVTRIGFMSGTFLSVMAPEIIRSLWGPGWEGSIPVLRWLAIVSIIQVPVATSGAALLGAGRADLYLRVGVIGTVTAVVAFAVTVQHGIVALAQAYLLANLVMGPLILGLTYRLYSSDHSRLVRILIVSLGAGIVVAVLCVAIKTLGADWIDWVRLTAAGLLCGAFAVVFLVRTTGIRMFIPALTLSRSGSASRD